MNTSAVKKEIPSLKCLFEIARLLGSPAELEEIYPKILSVLSQQMGMKRGGFLILNVDSNKWEIGGTHGISPEEMRRRKEYFGSGVAWRISEKGEMAAVIDEGENLWIPRSKRKESLKRTDVSLLCAPFIVNEAVAGILAVDHFYEEPVALTEDFVLSEEICSLISEAIITCKAHSAEIWDLVQENLSLRKELETLGRSVSKARKKISLMELLEERFSQMIAEIKVKSEPNGSLYNEVLNVVERTLLQSALEKTRHVQIMTARFLGINRNTLRRKMKELGIIIKK
jgi:transcriptional regulator with GAF, ATPase, and Fis domain